jgi:hypothetical protein
MWQVAGGFKHWTDSTCLSLASHNQLGAGGVACALLVRAYRTLVGWKIVADAANQQWP